MSEKTRIAKQANGGFAVWAKITGVLLIINIVIILVGTYVIYPTQAHRDISYRLTEMSQQFVTDDGTPVVETSEYKSLSATSEARYIATASITLGIVDFLLTIAIVGATYNYVRRNRLSKNHKEVGVTVLTNTIAIAVGWLVTLPFMTMLTGVAIPSVLAAVFQFVALTVLSLIVIFIIARIFNWLYNRKHSLVVE